MADFIKFDLGHLPAGSVVEIKLGHRANAHLVDANNFSRYRRGESFSGVGGEVLRSPVQLSTPTSDHWYAVFDLGGAAGRIEADVAVLSA